MSYHGTLIAEENKRRDAARTLLAALEELTAWCIHEDKSAKQCLPVMQAKQAIAAAKKAGVS